LTEARSAFCVHCNAWRGCLGLEPTPAMFLEHLVELFREVRRVLRDDGTIWCNLGDSYSGSGKGPSSTNGIGDQAERQGFVGSKQRTNSGSLTIGSHEHEYRGIPGKNLLMMPARFAIAMQDDGWYVRSAIVWAKTSAMPESVTDRPTSAHEMVYLFSKRATYFYDAEAVKERAASADRPQPTPDMKQRRPNDTPWHDNRYAPGASGYGVSSSGANLRNVWVLGPEPSTWDYCYACRRLFVGAERKAIKTKDGQRVCPCGASDFVAHYATFVSELPRRAIKAGTSERGCCPNCSAPWVRVTERAAPSYWSERKAHDFAGRKVAEAPSATGNYTSISHGRPENSGVGYSANVTTGWQPGCTCDAGEPIGCLVLDCFSGSATTGRVARQLGRRYIGLELSDRYAAASEALLAREDRPLFSAEPLPKEQQRSLL
jgi:DNA modification methylase